MAKAEYQNNKCASFDGDADRLVYWQFTDFQNNSSESLDDGDKLLCLFVTFFKKFLLDTGEVDVKLGCVTTGYTNSACIEYLKN